MDTLTQNKIAELRKAVESDQCSPENLRGLTIRLLDAMNVAESHNVILKLKEQLAQTKLKLSTFLTKQTAQERDVLAELLADRAICLTTKGLQMCSKAFNLQDETKRIQLCNVCWLAWAAQKARKQGKEA